MRIRVEYLDDENFNIVPCNSYPIVYYKFTHYAAYANPHKILLLTNDEFNNTHVCCVESKTEIN